MENNKKYWLYKLDATVSQITKDIDDLEKQMRLLVVDKDIPLDERWELFCKFAKECNRANLSNPFEFENKNFQKYLDSRQFNRYEDVDIAWELDTYYEWFFDDTLEENLLNDLKEVKEECLNKFIYSYNYN